jgi:hypothetical protein
VLQLTNFVLLKIITYTSIKMHHTIVVPFNSNANVHVIVSGYVCFVNVTLSSTLKGSLNLLELFGLKRYFRSNGNPPKLFNVQEKVLDMAFIFFQ